MQITASTIAAIIALLISASATYNAYILRGGKLAWTEVLIALGMILLMISLVLTIYLPDLRFMQSAKVSDALFILGFLTLLVASLKLRSSLE